MTGALTKIALALLMQATKRPLAAAALASVGAAVATASWWRSGETMAQRPSVVWPSLAVAFAAAVLGLGLYSRKVVRARDHMVLTSAIVPPPPFVTKPDFWTGVMCLPFLIVTIAFINYGGVDEGRSTADGTIVAATPAQNEEGESFTAIDVEFETADGMMITGATRTRGSVAVGDRFRVQYLDESPTDIRDYEPWAVVFLVAVTGTFSLIGLFLVARNLPRRMPFDPASHQLPGAGFWWQRTTDERFDIDEKLHVFAGDQSSIWIWNVGERSATGLVDWLRSGGAPNASTPAHWVFEVAKIERVELTPDKLTFFFVPGVAGRAKQSFSVRVGGQQIIRRLARSLAGDLRNDSVRHDGIVRRLFRQQKTSWRTTLAQSPA